MYYFIILKEVLKSAISLSILIPFVGIELSSMIGHYLTDFRQPDKVVQHLLNFDAILSGL